jgi:hypothetical protein
VTKGCSRSVSEQARAGRLVARGTSTPTVARTHDTHAVVQLRAEQSQATSGCTPNAACQAADATDARLKNTSSSCIYSTIEPHPPASSHTEPTPLHSPACASSESYLVLRGHPHERHASAPLTLVLGLEESRALTAGHGLLCGKGTRQTPAVNATRRTASIAHPLQPRLRPPQRRQRRQRSSRQRTPRIKRHHVRPHPQQLHRQCRPGHSQRW